mgnify:FL=1
MIDLNKIPNQQEKINEFIKVILNQLDVKKLKINDQMQNISKQSTSSFFNSIQNPIKPGNGFLVILISIVSLLNIFIQGFRDGIANAQKKLNEKAQQYGGKKKNRIQEQINNLNSLLNDADTRIEKLLQSKQSGGNTTGTVSGATTGNASVSGTTTGNASVSEATTGNVSGAEIMSIANDAFETASKIAVKKIGDLLNYSLEKTSEFFGNEDILNTPYDELSPQLNKKIVLIASLLNQILNNPATKESIREIAQIIASSLVELLREIQPDVDEVTEQAVFMLKKSAEKFSRGASNTGLAVAMSALGEIPYLGGIIDLVIAIGKGFNTLSSTFSETVDPATKVASKLGDMAERTTTTVEKLQNEIKEPIQQIKTTIGNNNTTIGNNNTTIGNNNMNLRGGVGNFLPNHKIHGKINAHRKRIAKTLKIFNKTLPKLKYTHSNKPYVLRNKSKLKRKKRSKKKIFKK